MYFCTTKTTNDFVNQAVAFYNLMNPPSFNLLKKLLPKDTPSAQLENILDDRIDTSENMISKNFSHLVTNAFLFLDVLAFNYYLKHQTVSEKYIKRLEETIMGLVTLSLKTKGKKSKHDNLLIKLFETSVRYSKFSVQNPHDLDALSLDYYTSDFEKYYLIDLASLTLWSDGKLELDEQYFLYKLAEKMEISDEFVADSIKETDLFLSTYKEDIAYFKSTNPVKNFYDQTTQNVVTLILRNKKRLGKEITESKELMLLLANSTHRDLDEKEKKKVKKQLLDICKSVPSLTIFLLPGGSLLLPILIKFIPQLLPSAFNENLEEE